MSTWDDCKVKAVERRLDSNRLSIARVVNSEGVIQHWSLYEEGKSVFSFNLEELESVALNAYEEWYDKTGMWKK